MNEDILFKLENIKNNILHGKDFETNFKNLHDILDEIMTDKNRDLIGVFKSGFIVAQQDLKKDLIFENCILFWDLFNSLISHLNKPRFLK